MTHTEEGETGARLIDGFPLDVREHLLAILEDSANAFIEHGCVLQPENAKVIRLRPARRGRTEQDPS